MVKGRKDGNHALLLQVRRNNLGQGQNKETGVVSLHNTINLVYLFISCSINQVMMKRKMFFR